MKKSTPVSATFDGNTLVISGLASCNTGSDDIANMIKNDSYIPNKRLWRRWIMAQTLRFSDEKTPGHLTFSQNFMQKKPYRYAWDTTIAELKAIAEMPVGSADRERRLCFYNKDMVVNMLREYETRMIKLIKRKTRYSYAKENRRPYSRSGNSPFKLTPYFAIVHTPDGKDAPAPVIHFAETHTSVVLTHGFMCSFTVQKCHQGDHVITADDLINNISEVICKVENERRYHRIVSILQAFVNTYPMSRLGSDWPKKVSPKPDTPVGTMSHDMPKPSAWRNAFIGAGAYYTMDNMIKFHDCHIKRDDETLSTEDSLKQLDTWVSEIGSSGNYYQLYRRMREFIAYNNFSIDNIKNEQQGSL